VFLLIDETKDKTAKERLADLRSTAAGGSAAVMRKLRKRGAGGASHGKAVEKFDSDSSNTRTLEKDFVIETHHIFGEKGHNTAASPPAQGFYAPSPLGPVGRLPTPPALTSDSPAKHNRHKSLVMSRLSAGAGGPPVYWMQDDADEEYQQRQPQAVARERRSSYPPSNGKKRGALRKKVTFRAQEDEDEEQDRRAFMAP
jgi:hypothetical protein